jgi:hypothetical protein
MIRKVISVSVLVASLLMAEWSQASSATIETPQLIVSDTSGRLSNDQLKNKADEAQAMLERILGLFTVFLR